MTTTLLRKALINYLANSTATSDEKKQIEAFIKDCDDIERNAGKDEIWHYECYILHTMDLVDLLNIATYDEYGRVYASNHGSVSLDQYKAQLKGKPFLNMLTDSTYELGYETIADLYEDNEQMGQHFPDGTFNPHADDVE